MESLKKLFGKTSKGEEVYAYTITNGKISAEILDFGATLRSIYVPDKNGNVADVTIGYEDFAPYETSSAYEGKTVGRYANRICGGKFEINGKEYNVEKMRIILHVFTAAESFHLISGKWKISATVQ